LLFYSFWPQKASWEYQIKTVLFKELNLVNESLYYQILTLDVKSLIAKFFLLQPPNEVENVSPANSFSIANIFIKKHPL